MAKRPALTDDNFLKHLFSPKKNALPTGIRKRTLALTKGRTKARLAAYNRMSPLNQETLRRSGLRDAYLNGTVRLTDARKALRQIAVGKGYAKPSKTKSLGGHIGFTTLDARVAAHVTRSLREAGRTVDYDRLSTNVPYMDQDDKIEAERWNVARIRAYAGDSSKIVEIDDRRFNPLWYR
jgi:hypothetical protein